MNPLKPTISTHHFCDNKKRLTPMRSGANLHEPSAPQEVMKFNTRKKEPSPLLFSRRSYASLLLMTDGQNEILEAEGGLTG